MVAKTQHFIHNPQAFLEQSAIKSAQNQGMAQFIGNGISNLASMSVFLCKQKGNDTTTTTTATTTTEAPKEEQEVTLPDKEKSEDIVKNLVKDFEKLPAGIQKDLVHKYNVIKTVTPDITEEVLTKRLNNYAQALKFHNAELAANTDDSVVYESACSAATTNEELVTAYEQFGTEYVELYDQNGDGAIDVHEMFYQELVDYYMSEGDDRTTALSKANAAEKLFTNFNLDALPNGDSAEEELFKRVVKKFKMLDIDDLKTISTKEAAIHLLSTAQLHDKLNNITAAEFSDSDLAMMFAGKDIADIVEWIKTNQDELPEGLEPLTDSEIQTQAEEIYQNITKYTQNSLQARKLFGLN